MKIVFMILMLTVFNAGLSQNNSRFELFIGFSYSNVISYNKGQQSVIYHLVPYNTFSGNFHSGAMYRLWRTRPFTIDIGAQLYGRGYRENGINSYYGQRYWYIGIPFQFNINLLRKREIQLITGILPGKLISKPATEKLDFVTSTEKYTLDYSIGMKAQIFQKFGLKFLLNKGLTHMGYINTSYIHHTPKAYNLSFDISLNYWL